MNMPIATPTRHHDSGHGRVLPRLCPVPKAHTFAPPPMPRVAGPHGHTMVLIPRKVQRTLATYAARRTSADRHIPSLPDAPPIAAQRAKPHAETAAIARVPRAFMPQNTQMERLRQTARGRMVEDGRMRTAYSDVPRAATAQKLSSYHTLPRRHVDMPAAQSAHVHPSAKGTESAQRSAANRGIGRATPPARPVRVLFQPTLHVHTAAREVDTDLLLRTIARALDDALATCAMGVRV